MMIAGGLQSADWCCLSSLAGRGAVWMVQIGLLGTRMPLRLKVRLHSPTMSNVTR